jgi:hypothetical protein
MAARICVYGSSALLSRRDDFVGLTQGDFVGSECGLERAGGARFLLLGCLAETGRTGEGGKEVGASAVGLVARVP